MAKWFVFRIDNNGLKYEDYREFVVMDTFTDQPTLEAFLDEHPDATVIYGVQCNIIKKHTVVETPEL
jgi:hypothetical protein